MPAIERLRHILVGDETMRAERDCSGVELFVRRTYSSLVYWRGYRRRHPDRPYYVPRAIEHLERLIDRSTSVFEWGSGVSTLWWAERVGTVTAIEHDETWFDRVHHDDLSDLRLGAALGLIDAIQPHDLDALRDLGIL